MKVNREDPYSFRFITITLESVNEALMLGEALRSYRHTRGGKGFVGREETPKDKIAEELLVIISQMGY